MKYKVFLASAFGMYLLSWWNGWELGGARRGLIPPEARQAAGGYRSYGFWRGGK